MIHSDTDDDSVVFVDSGAGPNCPHAITVVGNTHHETDQQKFCATSIYFDGDDNLECQAHADWAFGTSDFTIDAWIRVGAVPTASRVCALGDVETTNGTWCFGFGTTWGGGTKINFADRIGGSINDHLSSAITINTNTWHHITIVRDGGTLRFFLDGTACGTSACSHDLNASDKLYIGARKKPAAMGEFLTGYMDELRISNPKARWTVNFTSPTDPYVACV